MSLRIGDEAPDFTTESTQGTLSFHDWIGDGWAVLFSHPKDFTPVCTTELGSVAGLQPEFEKRNCKIVGLSVDSVSDHNEWCKDIEETTGNAVGYPLIGDTDLVVAKLFGMRPLQRHRQRRGADRGRQLHRALSVRDRARQEDQADAHLSHDHGSQLP